MKNALSRLDFNIANFRYVIAFTFFLSLSSVFFSPYTISVDGFSYLKSAEVLFTPEFVQFYTWIREPGYPLFIRVIENVGGLFLVFSIQGILIGLGILWTIFGTYKVLGVSRATWKTFVAAGISIVLLAGYASTLLQQALFVAYFGLLILIISRVVSTKKMDLKTGILIFGLILFSTLTAVFIGMAMALALFVTLVLCRVWQPKLLVGYFSLSVLAFLIVMVPWIQIKNAQAPQGAADAIAIGSSSAVSVLSRFDPSQEVQELIQTQAALLNLGGESPPSSGLRIANENVIFGAPVYLTDHVCGRFLHAGPADALWGKIETSYQDRCVPYRTLGLISWANRIAQGFYPLVGLALLFSLLLSFRFRAVLRPLIFPAFLVLSPYLLLDASISRYGALIIPLGAVLLVELVAPRSTLIQDGETAPSQKS
jgi:hypothetical protein